jgi:hypothetical protein
MAGRVSRNRAMKNAVAFNIASGGSSHTMGTITKKFKAVSMKKGRF